MELFVARAVQVADLIASARSRRAFLAGLSDFERLLSTALGFPRSCITTEDCEALRAIADRVIEQIERRLDGHGDRASVQRELAGKIYRFREEVEAIYTLVQSGCRESVTEPGPDGHRLTVQAAPQHR